MVNGINPISGISSLNSLNRIEKIASESASKVKGTSDTDFASVLKQALEEVNSQQKQSENIINEFAAGKISNIHDVIVTAEKASMSLKLTMEVRNSIVDAYREIMRMQL